MLSEGCSQQETVALSTEDQAVQDQVSRKCERNSPWSSAVAIQGPDEFFRLNSNVFKQEGTVNRVQLLIAFMSVMISLAIGRMFLDECDCGRLLCPFLIAQGSCGLTILFVHVLTVVLR